MGELKKNKFKKKACIRLLLKNLSAPISLTRLHSQRARQLAWYAFNSLGTSAGLGSNEKKKKKQQNKYTNENLYEKVRELSETIHTQNTKPRKIYTGERKEKKKKKSHWKLLPLKWKRKYLCPLLRSNSMESNTTKPPKFIDKLRSIPNSCQDCLNANCRRRQSEHTARMKCFTGARMQAQQAPILPEKHR